MKRFVQLALELEQTVRTSRKVNALSSYFQEVDAHDGAWAVRLLTGQRPKKLGASQNLRKLVHEHIGLPDWLMEACRSAVGDSSETWALLFPNQSKTCELSLAQTIQQYVLPLGHLDESGQRTCILEALDQLSAPEKQVYFKIIRGGFRMGVKKALVIKGLAAASGLEEAVLAHRLMGGLDATPEAFQQLIHPESDQEHALRAYPFFLAPPLEGEAHQLGDRKDWAAEWKWDGIRMQLVRRDGVELWTRGEEPISGQFPELVRAARALPEGTVLDGELLLWSEGQPKPFAELQTRLHRSPSPQTQFDLFDTTIPIMMVYDLLESDGIDRRDECWEQRRSRLEQVLQSITSDHFHLSEVLDGSWDALGEQRDGARSRQTEGLMLKHRQSIYGRGRSSGRHGWFKWKLDPYAVDCVLIGAQTGSGRRADLYTDYTFAVWQDDSPTAELVTFAKAYSGLTQKEIERLDRWIRANTLSQRGPFRQVKPMLVFELGFEGLRRSPRHKSGIAVRFPRILRWREDKPAHEADRVTALEVLLEPESSC